MNEKLYREDMDSKIRTKTQPAKDSAKSGIQTRRWEFDISLIRPQARPVRDLRAFLRGLKVCLCFYSSSLRGEALSDG